MNYIAKGRIQQDFRTESYLDLFTKSLAGKRIMGCISGSTNLALVANYIILVPYKYTRENKLAGISMESHKDLDYNR